MSRTGSASLLMRIVTACMDTSIVCELSGGGGASAMQYAVPDGDPKQCQWEPHPALKAESHNDHNSVPGFDLLLIFTSLVSICHAALSVLIAKPNLFRHRNTGFASRCHNLSSIIVVK